MGNQDGQGCSFYPNGSLNFKGEWKLGKKNGLGQEYHESSKFEVGPVKYTGGWRNELYHGEGTLYK